MADYCECRDCGFVLEADTGDDPVPKRWTSCPDCDGTRFRFLGDDRQ